MNNWADKWNERYRSETFAYGISPNEYFKKQIDELTPGRILLPADGEGRNGVYAATKGWTVCSFDISTEGKRKAELLAKNQNTTIEYHVCDPHQLNYPFESFDVLALIYAHFPGPIKSEFHQHLNKFLKPGGYIIFEAFSKEHLKYNSINEKVGGPKDLDTLFSVEEIINDFPGYDMIELCETEIELSEGSYHQGRGSVIRFFGKKL